MKYQAVIFDLDGTLINTNCLILNSFLHTFAEHDLHEYGEADVLPYMGEPLLDQMRRIDPSQAEEMAKTYHQFNVLRHDDDVEAFPSVAETLVELSQSGIRMGVVSNKRRKVVEMGLDRFQFTSVMETVVCIDDPGMKPKPEPDMIVYALKQLQVSPVDVLMVGDSRYDIVAAKRAGVDSAGVAWSLHPEKVKQEEPTFMLQDMSDLLNILKIKEGENA